MKIVFILALIFGSLACTTTDAKNKVVGISDGDTFTLLMADNTQIKIRLYGIDCPEKAQDFGEVAKQKLSSLIFNQSLRIDAKDMDRYGRTVAIAFTEKGLNVNEEMLKAGLAWHYREYDKNNYWDELEETAREKKLGLWAQPNPTPPWNFRKEKRREENRR